MKIKLIVLLIVAATATAMFAQNPNIDYRFGFKLYNLATYDHRDDYKPTYPIGLNYNRTSTDDLRLLHPTIAFQWKTKKKNNFHEIELTEFRWDNTDSRTQIGNDSIKNWTVTAGETVSHVSVAARYEYTLVLGKKKERRIVPSVGFAGSPYFRSYHYFPEAGSAFPESRKDIGIQVFVVPRLTLYTKKRFYFDMNLPLCVGVASYSHEENQDPAAPAVLRDVQSFDMNMLPKYFSARIGIGIKI